jgi:hypothetical protein
VRDDITDPAFRTALPTRTQGLTIGFTGTRESPAYRQRFVIDLVLQHLHLAKGFVTGGCIGIDHFVGLHLLQRYPDKQHTVIVPADRSRVAAWWRPYGDAVRVVEMPPESEYRARNREIVLRSGALIGFPAHAETHPSSRRSGSWQTIRMAQAIHPIVLPLEAM